MKKSKKILALAAAAALCLAVLAGCGKGQNTPPSSDETGDGAAKPVILVVSFGTSYNDSRDKTIGAVENAIAAAYPDYEVRRAFTSQTIIDILAEREGLEIDNVDEAFDRLIADGVQQVVVQPTHVMSGYEYDDLMAAVEEYQDQFASVAVGAPLLSSDEDYSRVVEALCGATAEQDQDGTAIVFMGHGTEHEANASYAKLQDAFHAAGKTNYLVGTVEATPSLNDILSAVQAGDYTKVVLQPLMVVAGDHAVNDMAGEEEDSWKSLLKQDGFETECILKGLGEFPQIQDMYVQHIFTAVAK